MSEPEARLNEAYRIRMAYHQIPDRERWIEFVKWLDKEVADCEKAAGIKGVANVIRSRQKKRAALAQPTSRRAVFGHTAEDKT